MFAMCLIKLFVFVKQANQSNFGKALNSIVEEKNFLSSFLRRCSLVQDIQTVCLSNTFGL